MSALVVEVEGRVLHLEGKPVYRIGRAIEADVVLSAGSVSRLHAELRATQDGWVLVDTGSQFGTYVDDERITEYPIERRIAVRCGLPAPGAELTVVPAEQYAAASAAPGPPPAPALDNEQTQVLAPAVGPAESGQPHRTGPDLLLVAEGREHRFRHPAEITVGRRNDCTVVIGDPACSRMHGRIDAVPGAWTYTNLSNEGTFLDGRRMPTRKFDERLDLRLGHPVAGPELTLVPILSAQEEERRIARRRLGRRLAIAGAAAGVLLLVGGIAGLAVWVARDGDSSGPAGPDGDTMAVLTAAELEAAKAATVKITARSHLVGDPSSTGTYHGSGSIIREDGLILTNAHVAAPESPGLEETYGDGQAIANPDYLMISLTDGMTDTNAPPSYRARVVVADGDLDIAVIQVYADADGSDLEDDPDLPTVPIGSSEELRAGDDVTVLGFPAVAGSGESITVTTGVVSTVLNDPELGPRSELDTDARIAPGNSGGMAINNDAELIGVPTALQSARGSTVTSGRIRSIDAAKELIDRAAREAD